MSAFTLWILSGFFAPLPSEVRLTLLASGAVVLWMAKQLPEARRQIPAEVFRGGIVRGAMRFGFEMGTGVRTYSPSPAPYLLALAILMGTLPLGHVLLLGLGFGFGRALPLFAGLARSEGQPFTLSYMAGGDQFGPGISTGLVLLGAISLV